MAYKRTTSGSAQSGTYVPLAGGTSTGEQVAPSFKATGKTGATATPITLAGGTASGAPASGAHVKGELVLDDTGAAWYCTVAGTPGTWVQVGASAPASLYTSAIPGEWYLADLAIEGAGVSALSFSALYASPKLLRAGTIVGIAARHFGTPTGGEFLRLGIYADNGTGYPGALVIDAGTIDLSTAAAVKSITISQAISTAGLYWLVGVQQGGSGSATMLVFSAVAGVSPAGNLMPAAADFVTRTAGWITAGVTGALPANYPAGATAQPATLPVIGVKY